MYFLALVPAISDLSTASTICSYMKNKRVLNAWCGNSPEYPQVTGCWFLSDIQGNAEAFTTRNGPAFSIFEKMQLFNTRKLKTQLTSPRLHQLVQEVTSPQGFFIPPSALMKWTRFLYI